MFFIHPLPLLSIDKKQKQKQNKRRKEKENKKIKKMKNQGVLRLGKEHTQPVTEKVNSSSVIALEEYMSPSLAYEE